MGRETWGPYDQYEEVQTPHGVFGIPAGQTLSFDNHGRAVFGEAEDVYQLAADDGSFTISSAGDIEFYAGAGDSEDAVTDPVDEGAEAHEEQ